MNWKKSSEKKIYWGERLANHSRWERNVVQHQSHTHTHTIKITHTHTLLGTSWQVVSQNPPWFSIDGGAEVKLSHYASPTFSECSQRAAPRAHTRGWEIWLFTVCSGLPARQTSRKQQRRRRRRHTSGRRSPRPRLNRIQLNFWEKFHDVDRERVDSSLIIIAIIIIV